MNETLSTININSQLVNLGWCITGNKRNVFVEGECKTKEQKNQLQKKRPDYILYESNSINPLGIIEAKKPNGDLDKALKQGFDYAKKIGAKIIFASDGFIVKAMNIYKKTLTIDEERIEGFVSENILKKLVLTPNLETDSNIIKNRNELIKLFDKANNSLRADGVDVGIDSIYEFCSILFIKLKSETDKKIEEYYSWNNLVQNSGQNLYKKYTEIIGYFKKKYKGIFREIKIQNPATLEKIVISLKALNISNTNIDIKGGSYEYFLKRYSSKNKSVLGQYFTPRHITQMLTILLNPKIDEKIYDPFCGTGGMLTECYKFIRKNITQNNQIKKLNLKTLFGNDITLGASQLAKMNMVLLGDGHSNIQKLDSLNNPVNNKYDCVITNIPFNLPQTDKGRLYNSGDTNSNNICLRHCIQSIKKGGRACIIIPENICYDNHYQSIRKFLSENGNIKAVIRLPRETFKTYTTARTCILYITDIKQSKTKNYSYIEIKNDGYSKTAWREPTLKNDIPKILEYREELGKKSIRKLNSNYHFIVERKCSVKTTKKRQGGGVLFTRCS